jgi:hypothetical protein
LGELELPIRAQVLVAKTACDLKVLLEARHHQDLLEELGRLGQRVPLAAVDAGGHQEIARAFGRRPGQHRRFDLEESALVEHLPHPERDLVAEHEVLQHRRPPQVEIPVLEPELFGRVGAILDDERRRLRARQELQTRGDDLDVAGRQITVALPFPAHHDLALDGDDVLVARLGRRTDGRLRTTRPVEDDLDDPASVAQRQEDEVAEVPAARDPALEEDRLPRVGAAQGAGGLSLARHRSLPAPSRSASCALEKVCCSPVDRSLMVTDFSSRSRDPRRTAWIPPARNAY